MANKGRILVVDDDRLVLATLSHGLAQAGYDVIDADNGDDAILLAREHRPDLALLDIRMEGMSGFDVATYLRDYLQMPFMFLSAFSDDATIRHVKQLGAVAYLVKPLDIKQIVPAVEAAFADIAHHRGRSPAVPVAPAARAMPPAGQEPSNGSPALKGEVQDPVVAMAIGVLMHRYSLSRAAALARLERMAAAESRTTGALAERLLAAIELLAAGG